MSFVAVELVSRFRFSTGTRYVSFVTDTSSIGIRLAGGDKHGLFICEVQPTSVAQKAGLLVADKIFSVSECRGARGVRKENDSIVPRSTTLISRR